MAIGALVARLVAVVAVLAVAAGVAVPSIRTSIRKKILPHYTAIPIKGVVTYGKTCPDATVGEKNTAVLWMTHSPKAALQFINVYLQDDFKGDVAKVGITQIDDETSPGNLGKPYPSKLQIGLPPVPPSQQLSGPAISLSSAKFQSRTVKIRKPKIIQVMLVASATDVGSCVQTALVFYEKN
jgi:hypothetical protein